MEGINACLGESMGGRLGELMCVCVCVCVCVVCVCVCVCVCMFIHENPIFTLFECELTKYNKINIVNKTF